MECWKQKWQHSFSKLIVDTQMGSDNSGAHWMAEAFKKRLMYNTMNINAQTEVACKSIHLQFGPTIAT